LKGIDMLTVLFIFLVLVLAGAVVGSSVESLG
jgi:hypothetical protein